MSGVQSTPRSTLSSSDQAPTDIQNRSVFTRVPAAFTRLQDGDCGLRYPMKRADTWIRFACRVERDAAHRCRIHTTYASAGPAARFQHRSATVNGTSTIFHRLVGDRSTRRLARGALTIMVFGAITLLFPAESIARKIQNHTCSVAETGRIAPGKEAQCLLNGGTPKCEAGGWRCCYQRQDGGTSCGGLRNYTSFDPTPPGRPPRAGWPDPGPDRVTPPLRPPRADAETGPDRVGPPTGPGRPPRMDPGPGRIGPSSNPTGGGPILRFGGGSGKR